MSCHEPRCGLLSPQELSGLRTGLTVRAGLLGLIRPNWVTGNAHWVLEVAFNEALPYIRAIEAASDLPVLRHITSNASRRGYPCSSLVKALFGLTMGVL